MSMTTFCPFLSLLLCISSLLFFYLVNTLTQSKCLLSRQIKRRLNASHQGSDFLQSPTYPQKLHNPHSCEHIAKFWYLNPMKVTAYNNI